MRSYQRTHGLPACITRCSNNYGPHQFPEKVIPLFVTNLLDGRKVPLYGDGLNVRDWLHVDDHCRGIQLVAEGGRPGEVYNIGGGTELTNADLTRRLVAAVGADESMIEHVADRKGHDRRYSVDWSKIATELGYAPRTSFDDGLAATVALVHRAPRLVGAAQGGFPRLRCGYWPAACTGPSGRRPRRWRGRSRRRTSRWAAARWRSPFPAPTRR